MASPLLGYNNNFRHKNRVFHVQTEDSGVKRPHIITHLFADGGRIVKSVKTSYVEYVGNPKMVDIVKEMMKQQHKAMIIALRDGQFDLIIDPKPKAPAAVESAPEAAPDEKPKTDPKGLASLAATDAVVAVTAMSPVEASRAETQLAMPQVAAPEDIPDTTRNPHQDHELTLDIDALERAAAAAETESSLFQHASDLPPPPENLFREKSATGGYKSVAPPPPASTDTERPPPRRGPHAVRAANIVVPGPPRTPSDGHDANEGGHSPAPGAAAANANANATTDGASEGRYGNARPAAIFGNKAKLAPSKSLFGEDLISDKSLDEVILSYLAEDLDPQAEKK